MTIKIGFERAPNLSDLSDSAKIHVQHQLNGGAQIMTGNVTWREAHIQSVTRPILRPPNAATGNFFSSLASPTAGHANILNMLLFEECFILPDDAAWRGGKIAQARIFYQHPALRCFPNNPIMNTDRNLFKIE